MLHTLVVRGWGVEERKRKVRREEGGWSNWQMEGDRLTPKQKATAYALLRHLRLIDLRATSDIDNCTLPAFCEGGRPIRDNYQHNETASTLFSPLRCRGVLTACIRLSQCALQYRNTSQALAQVAQLYTAGNMYHINQRAKGIWCCK